MAAAAIPPLLRLLPAALLVLISGLLPIASADEQARGQLLNPDKGRFLIATRKLHGTSFEKTVILITEYGPGGAAGLTINRATRMPLQEAIPALKLHEETSDLMVYLGGPVHTDMVFILQQYPDPQDHLIRIFDDVFLGAGLDLLINTLTDEPDPDSPARPFFGYAGWAPGQLEAEIERGDWAVGDGDPDYIFHLDPEQVWQRLMARWSGQWI